MATQAEFTCEVILRAMNAVLPSDVRVLEVAPAPVGFHAVRDAIAKTYRYKIQTGQLADLFLRKYAWHVRGRLDLDSMKSAAERLVGVHDFASFQSAGSTRLTTVRCVQRLLIHEWMTNDFPGIEIEITANGFLYNMVRSIVGTLIIVGHGKQRPDWIDQVLTASDRRRAGPTAPAHGLYLAHVEYGF